MEKIILVALGGALGAVARFFLTFSLERFSLSFPWNTLIVNMIGSFFISVFLVLSIRCHLAEQMRLLSIVGFCGSFTTFSTFSLQTFELMKNGAFYAAFLNIILSVVLCMLMVFLGFYLSQKM